MCVARRTDTQFTMSAKSPSGKIPTLKRALACESGFWRWEVSRSQ